MDIQFDNVPADTDFDVNIRFGAADSFINIPVDQSITGGAGSGTLGLPFTIEEDLCARLSAQRQRVACCESISVDGVMVSTEQARELILNCESDADRRWGVCLYNYRSGPGDLVQSWISSAQQFIDQSGEELFYTIGFTPGVGPAACGSVGARPEDTVWDSMLHGPEFDELGEVGALQVTVSLNPPPQPIPLRCGD